MDDDGKNEPSSKRYASSGNWLTPPQIFFPSVSASPSSAATSLAASSVKSDDDSNYQAALLNAYNRGVEAATALSSKADDETTIMPAAKSANVVDNNMYNSNVSLGSTVASYMPHKIASMPIMCYPSNNLLRNNPRYFLPTINNTTATSTAMTITSQQQQQEQRSTSLPNLRNNNNNKEDRREKRLERNRTSAKLRRSKKKILVDNYISEVNALESSLNKMQSHKWGETATTASSSRELIDALSMDRVGSSSNRNENMNVPTKEERQRFIQGILQQQLDQIESLMESHMELMTLRWFLLHTTSSTDEFSKQNLTQEEQEILVELQECVFGDLSQQQRIQLLETTQNIENEYDIYKTIHLTLSTLLKHENNYVFLHQPFIEDIVQNFYNIMNTNQMTKFLLWTDCNSDAINCLDYVNANTTNVDNNGLAVQQPNFIFNLDIERMEGQNHSEID